MANNRINELLKFANMQMAAEAFLLRSGDALSPTGDPLIERLREGNAHASKFPLALARDFDAKWNRWGQSNHPRRSIKHTTPHTRSLTPSGR